MPSSRRPPPSEPAAASRIWLVVAVVAVFLGALGAWLLWPREDKLGAVTEIQKQLLEAGSKPSRAAIDQLIRTVDRLDRRDVGSAYRAAGAEWKRIKREAIDAYFQAAATDRPRLLDEHIARMEIYHDLLVAMNPGAQPGSPAYLPRDRRRRDQKAEPATPPDDAARQQLEKRFEEAIEAHAKSRVQPLPVFR